MTLITLICIIHVISLMRLIALILIIRIMTGPSRSWNCRSRVAGQKGGYCRNCWCIGRSVSHCNARRLAFLHPSGDSGLPGERRPCSRPTRGARLVGAPGLSPLFFCLLRTLILFDRWCRWPFFSMNSRPKHNSLFCNNATNCCNKWNNSVIMINNSLNTEQFQRFWLPIQLA